MATKAMTTVLAAAVMLTGAGMAESIDSTSPRHLGPVTSHPEKNTFGYVAINLVEQPRAVTLGQEARYVGRRTDVEEKDTFGFVEMRPKLSAGLTK